MARASQHRASRVRHGWFASTTTAPKRPAPTFCADRERDHGAPSRMRGRRSGSLDGRERSRMGDAFRPPSPAPFVTRGCSIQQGPCYIGLSRTNPLGSFAWG